jgi:hypothetical protein
MTLKECSEIVKGLEPGEYRDVVVGGKVVCLFKYTDGKVLICMPPWEFNKNDIAYAVGKQREGLQSAQMGGGLQ